MPPSEGQEFVFTQVDQCNMCAADAATAKVLGQRLSTSQGLRPTRRVGVSTTVMRCSECGLIFPNPLPTPRDIGQHYETPPEEYWKPEYFELDPEYFRHQIEMFRRLWRADGQPIALDVGAGIGKCMKSLEANGFEVHGLEPSAAFREAAIDRGGIDPNRLALSTVERATYEPATFDFVTFGAVLEHLPDPAGQIARAMEWLAPGGLLFLDVPSADWLTARIVNFVYRVQGLDYVSNISPMHAPYHLYEFTAESFRRQGERVGYSVAYAKPHPTKHTFLPGPDRLWRRLMERTGTGMQLEMWLRAEDLGAISPDH